MIQTIFASLVLAASTTGANSEPLPSLIERIPSVARSEHRGVSPEEQELAKAIQSYGPDAIPSVLPLLKSKDANVRRFAGFVLRGLKGLTEAQLEPLMDAMTAGDGWIAPAIGRIGSPKAVAFLLAQFKAKPQPFTQTTSALKLAGAPAAVALAREFESAQPVSPEYVRGVCHVFGDMGDNAGAALDPLVGIATSEQSDTTNRLFAVKAIGCLGLQARRAIPNLRALSSRDRRFIDSVDLAIMEIGSPEAAPSYTAELRLRPTTNLLRDIAERGDSLRDVGPTVVELLTSEDWDLRVAAARTLGYIGYDAAASSLMATLGDARDWRLPYVAAESLGRLHAVVAVAALARLKTEHWYPAVRHAAAKALEVIEGQGTYRATWPKENFAFEFYAYEGFGGIKSPAHLQPVLRPGKDELTNPQLAAIKFDAKIVSFGEQGSHEHHIQATPVVALRVSHGLLVGSNRGEWGGELVFLNERGEQLRLLDVNTRGIHAMPFGIVAVTGLAHLGFNAGALYLVKEAGASYVATKWRILPGAPSESGFLENGDLFVACDGGDIVVTRARDIRMADERDLPRVETH